MSSKEIVNAQGEIIIPDPPIARVLFSTVRFAWFWLIIRLFLGWQWLSSGWGKFGNPAWMLLARSFGWNGHHVTRSAALRETLDKALAKDGPSLVVIPIDYRENALLTKKLGEITAQI